MYYGERFNGYSHLAGALLALLGSIVLVVLGSLTGNVWKIVSFAIYGSTLVLLYSFSTLYHSTRGRLKQIFRKLDHQSIYLLIAGTYTPFTLVSLQGPWGWSLFAAVWTLAIIGIVQEFETPGNCSALSISAISLSVVMPGRHSDSGFRLITVSNISVGAGSVAVLARPALP